VAFAAERAMLAPGAAHPACLHQALKRRRMSALFRFHARDTQRAQARGRESAGPDSE